ncbi:Hypothetical protein D9617_1g081740 [Elsinoe fawcettii]|nr:Hypothetical protein D9617_1g081740 [Elsinoe fawcettii]
MAPYDSDSSDGEDDYTETGVLLGYASKEATDDAISHLGGHPAWLDDKTAPSGDLAKCKVCNNLLSLLLELNGDLPERFPGHERRLYLLGCRQKACRRKEGSVRGIRAVRSSKLAKQAAAPSPVPQEAPKPKADLGSSIFGSKPTLGSSSSNPFASPGASSTGSNPFASASSLAAKSPQRPDSSPDVASLPATFAEKARISAPQESSPHPHGLPPPWPATSSFPPSYPHYSLDADYETLEKPPSTIPSQTRVDMDIDEPPNGASSSGSKDKDANQEVFESSMDKTFQRFADRVAQNPEQVLRYEYGGTPLLYSRDDSVGKILAPAVGEVSRAGGASGRSKVPRCTTCGGERVFELQLMPNAITELEAEEMGVDGMDWGTIVLEVCGKDCVPNGVKEGEVAYVEEWVAVQWEEVVKRK